MVRYTAALAVSVGVVFSVFASGSFAARTWSGIMHRACPGEGPDLQAKIISRRRRDTAYTGFSIHPNLSEYEPTH